MGADHAAEDLRGDADDGADHNEEKNGEIVLEVHDEALVERSVEKTLQGLQYRIAQSWLFAYTRIVRLETQITCSALPIPTFEARRTFVRPGFSGQKRRRWDGSSKPPTDPRKKAS
jgi:hypothetical protein